MIRRVEQCYWHRVDLKRKWREHLYICIYIVRHVDSTEGSKWIIIRMIGATPTLLAFKIAVVPFICIAQNTRDESDNCTRWSRMQVSLHCGVIYSRGPTERIIARNAGRIFIVQFVSGLRCQSKSSFDLKSYKKKLLYETPWLLYWSKFK